MVVGGQEWKLEIQNVEAVIHAKCVCVPQRSCSRDGCRGVGSLSNT